MLLHVGLAAHAVLLAGSMLLPLFPAAQRQGDAPGGIVVWKVMRVAGSNVITLSRTCAIQSEPPRTASEAVRSASNIVPFDRSRLRSPQRRPRRPAC
jgi:hypothetical protein